MDINNDNSAIIEKNNILKKAYWDALSESYFQGINRSTAPMTGILISLARVSNKLNILEAGCGPGFGTKLITCEAPVENCAIYAFDLSSQMIKLCLDVFENYKDFNMNPNNSWSFLKINTESGKKISINEDLQEIRKTHNGKVVKFFEGSVEFLNFEDEQFDVYISSLCLMLCSDRIKALQEAYRVLKPGGCAAIGIWGKKEDTKLVIKLYEEVINNNGIDISFSGKFEMASDEGRLRKEFADVGFTDIRLAYTNIVYDCYNEDDFFRNFYTLIFLALKDRITDTNQFEDLLNKIRIEIGKQMVEPKIMPVLNMMLIVAFK